MHFGPIAPWLLLSQGCVALTGSLEGATASGSTCTPREPSGVVGQGAQGDLWATIHGPDDAESFGMYMFGMVGDVDGDECEDLVVGASDGMRLFLGPLGRGDWSAADEADAHFETRDGADIARAGDLDGDGADEFWVAGQLFTYTDGIVAVAFDAGGRSGDLVDLDGDSVLDAVVNMSNSTVIAYGPLDTWKEPTLATGCHDSVTVPQSAACIVPIDPSLGRPNTDGGYDYDVLADVTGDGHPEIIVIDYGDFSEGEYRSNAVLFAGGDLRGQTIGTPLAQNSRPHQ